MNVAEEFYRASEAAFAIRWMISGRRNRIYPLVLNPISYSHVTHHSTEAIPAAAAPDTVTLDTFIGVLSSSSFDRWGFNVEMK